MCGFREIWESYKKILLLSITIIVGFSLILLRGFIPYGDILFILGILLAFGGLLACIFLFITGRNFWAYNAIFSLFLALCIGFYVIVTRIENYSTIQALFNTFITIDIAILTISFAAIAIKPETFLTIKKDFRNYLLITSVILLLSTIFYCLSYFIPTNDFGFKVVCAGLIILTIVAIFNLSFFMIYTFDKNMEELERKKLEENTVKVIDNRIKNIEKHIEQWEKQRGICHECEMDQSVYSVLYKLGKFFITQMKKGRL